MIFTIFGSLFIILIGGSLLVLRAVVHVEFYMLSLPPGRPVIKLMLALGKKDINLIAPWIIFFFFVIRSLHRGRAEIKTE